MLVLRQMMQEMDGKSGRYARCRSHEYGLLRMPAPDLYDASLFALN